MLESRIASQCATLEFLFLFEPELLEAFLLECGGDTISETGELVIEQKCKDQ